MHFRELSHRAVGVGIAAALLAGGSARAAVHASTITDPSGTAYLTDDVDAGTQLSVDGTYTADSGADNVDVRCYGDSTLTLQNGAGTGGSFAATGDLASLLPTSTTSPAMNVCRLRAVPHATTPSNLAPFNGPVVAVGKLSRGQFTFASGPNANHLADTFFSAPQLSGADDYEGLGDCGLQDGLLVDPSSQHFSNRLFFCNDWYGATDTWPGPSRSELRIDGTNAYAPSAIDGNFDHVDLSLSAGFPSFTFGPTRDPATGDATIGETDGISVCPGNPYPPTSDSCGTLADSGVAAQRSIAQDHDGRVVRIVDRFVSTDGKAHDFDGLVENDFFASTTAFRFPWVDGGTYHEHTATDIVPGAPGAPASIFVKGNIASSDGDANNPQGSITFSSPPDDVRFLSPTMLLLHYHRTVPATGALTLVFTYAMGSSAAEVAGYASDAEDLDSAPVVTISNPVNGARLGSANLNVRGIATDVGGVRSLSVNGTPVALGPGGTWGLNVKLPLGKSAFTATATDKFGNAGSAQVQVTYARCVVPRLVGLKLSTARKRLAQHGCAARAKRRYSTRVRRYRVVRQGSKRLSVHTLGRHITLIVSKGRHAS
jgi:hypothetical protein